MRIPAERLVELPDGSKKPLLKYFLAAQDSQPVPGVDDAVWSEHGDLRWALIPGWSHVRLVSWRDDVCERGKIPEVLKALIAAKEPPEGAERLDLVPRARE